MKNLPPVHYRVFPSSPQAHLFEVTCTLTDPDPEGQRFALPAWIPGSYLIRDFARHVVSIRAQSGRKPLPIAKLDKHTWIVAPTAGPVSRDHAGVCLRLVGARGAPGHRARLLQRPERVPAAG